MNDLSLSAPDAKYVVTTITDEVLTIRMNHPQKLNGWTLAMMTAIKAAMHAAGEDDRVKAIILTGTGNYYSAGVNLSSTIQLMHPRKLRDMIQTMNQALFEIFLHCPKPILVAFNGPAIGASVTSATLCNAMIASDNATFLLPFAKLGVPPEGCSSVHLARMIGETNAQRMLGEEGWQPTAQEALDVGLVQTVVAADALVPTAQAIAREWVDKDVPREFMAGSQRDELLAVNAQESMALANAFLAPRFLRGQGRFLWSKGKYGPALMFYIFLLLRPLWVLTLK